MTSEPLNLYFLVPYYWHVSITLWRPQMESEFAMTRNHWVHPLLSLALTTDVLGEKMMCYANVCKMSATSYNNNMHHICILIFSLLHKMMPGPKACPRESHFVGSVILYLNLFFFYGHCTVLTASSVYQRPAFL